jgi:hypothetical protein
LFLPGVSGSSDRKGGPPCAQAEGDKQVRTVKITPKKRGIDLMPRLRQPQTEFAPSPPSQRIMPLEVPKEFGTLRPTSCRTAEPMVRYSMAVEFA